MRKNGLWFIFGCIVISLCFGPGCAREEAIHVASKNFSENEIIAEMFALLARENGLPVTQTIPYGNTFDLQEAVKAEKVDLYPEYTGTGLSMMGVPAMSDGDKAFNQAKELFIRFGIQWLPRLGFNNSYVLVMQEDVAARLGIKQIGDLAGKTDNIILSCEEEFVARPVDGYPALMRRYGFTPEPEVITGRTFKQIYRNLVTGRAQVAVTQRTDPQIAEFNLRVLEDNLNFFPAYECAPVVRREVLDQHPSLEKILEQMHGRISNNTMRDLNRKVELDGLDARTVAIEYLTAQNLITKKPLDVEKSELIVAVPPLDHRSALLARGLNAIRQISPGRQVIMRSFTDPVTALFEGKAFIAILGAENFFTLRPGSIPETNTRIEAIIPLGNRVVHLLRRAEKITKKPFDGISRIGVGPAGGSSEKAAGMLLDAYGKSDTITLVNGTVDRQVRAVSEKKLDAVLELASPGDAQIILFLEKFRLSLQPLTGWNLEDRQFRYPFLRLSRISPESYPRLTDPVETVGSQLVFAGPKPKEALLGDGDPVSGLRTQRQAIPRSMKEDLAAALETKETIDPALPGERVTTVTARRDVQAINPAPGVSFLTALFLAGMGVLFYSLLRRKS